MKTKNELKAALSALQVQKPLRLPTAMPTFTPPSIADSGTNTTEVEITTPVLKSTKVEKATSVSESTSVENQTQVANSTVIRNTSSVEKNTPVVETTPVPSLRRATEQDSSVILEARAAEGLEKGYTRLPNTTLMRLASGDFTKNEIKLALLIARFTISFQQRHAPLSKTVLERRSGLRGPAILEALAGLVSKGLIEKIQGDQHRPNQLGLVLPPDWDQLLKPTKDGNSTSGGKSTPVAQQTHAEVENSTRAGIENPIHFKDKEIYSNKNSFSQLPEKLTEYFSDLKPEKKRESEWHSFQKLSEEYSAENIADCFSFVRNQGIKQGNEMRMCHSPMAFLSKAIAEILPKVNDQNRISKMRAQEQQNAAESQVQKAMEEARQSAELLEREQAFKNTFPDSNRQYEVLTELCRGSMFRSNTTPGRIFAIDRWWDSLSPQDRSRLSL